MFNMFDDEWERKICERIVIRLVEAKEDVNISQAAITIAPVLSFHLKYYLSYIIRCMAASKRKCLFHCPLLTGENKRNIERSDSPMSTQVIYDDSPFTSKDFLELLRDNKKIIPHPQIYEAYVKKLMKQEFVKPPLQKKVAENTNNN